MDYVTSLGFEEAADFSLLKNLIVEAGVEARLNIFDNIYDWSILLTDKKKIVSTNQKNEPAFAQNNPRQFSSSGNINIESGNRLQYKNLPNALLETEKKNARYASFRFETFNDVKLVIY